MTNRKVREESKTNYDILNKNSITEIDRRVERINLGFAEESLSQRYTIKRAETLYHGWIPE